MTISRRIFFRLAAVVLTLGIVSNGFLGCASAGKSDDNKIAKLNTEGPFSIVQGFTTPTSTVLTIVIPRQLDVDYKITSSIPKNAPTASVSREFWETNLYAVDKIIVEGLDLTGLYTLDVTDKSGKTLDQRFFRAFDPKKKDIKFFVGSCIDDRMLDHQFEMWKQAVAHRPELMFIIGDSSYADSNVPKNTPTPPTELWNRFADTRNLIQFYKEKELIPTLVTWDDHDYGWRDGDSSHPFKADTTKIFKTFFGIGEKPTQYITYGPGVSFFAQMAGQNFAFMDNRSFASPLTVPASEQTQYGKEQENWLSALLKKNKNPTWIINGGQFFGAYHKFDSFAGSRPESFKKTLTQWRKAPPPIVFISGDRHLFEVMKISKADMGYETYEFTTSAIHARVYESDWFKNPNPRQMKGVAGQLNYMIFTSSADKKQLNIHAQAFSQNSEVLFDEKLTVKK